MVTSTKLPDKNVVKMADQNNSTVVPQRTLLGEVNEHITCPLCRGYYVDATTIVECLHSFCRSCIIKHLQSKSYCPVCEMMINSAKPNIKLDKALQDIVYKLVPGLFQKEMERRQHFYASRPGPAASATPEQRGEDTERIIFSPEDVISFSLEYTDATDADSISSKSSDSNEIQPSSATTRRYLQCPAIVNISHLKKFLSMKFDVDSTQFAIDILYKRVPLPDCYTLMDIAYIYNWKRNEPMRFFYQIIDYVAIRNRLFESNIKGSHFQESKSSPTLTEETVVSSPVLNLNDQCSEASSGTDSPMPDDDNMKKQVDLKKNNHNAVLLCKDIQRVNDSDKESNKIDKVESLPKSDEDVEKSQFLNSFELTAKNNNTQCKSSSSLSNVNDDNGKNTDSCKSQTNSNIKTDDTLKRKIMSPVNVPEVKKIKLELEKPNPTLSLLSSTLPSVPIIPSGKTQDMTTKIKENEVKKSSLTPVKNNLAPSTSIKDTKQQATPAIIKTQISENISLKRSVSLPQSTSSQKRKSHQDLSSVTAQVPKTVSPLKIQIPKPEPQGTGAKSADVQKPVVKKLPDLKPSGLNQSISQKIQPVNKVRMDLLANNSDPTIDRSKILSQVNSSLHAANIGQSSGDPLKSLFDSCKINIPSSLSITLTDQKLDPRSTSETSNNGDQNKNLINKNLTAANNTTSHKVPSPPVHNYIEILKLPDSDSKKQQKTDSNIESKSNSSSKTETNMTQSKPNKSSETSTKGPIPNLKPIADTKLGKQSGSYSAPITFQQTFEQQLQSLSDKKSKVLKNKAQVPKLFPASHKAFSAASKTNNPVTKPPLIPMPIPMPNVENKTSAALDLSTPHNVQSQLDPQQAKAFETMQAIANLAKKQNLPSKGSLPTMSQSTYSNITNRPMNRGGLWGWQTGQPPRGLSFIGASSTHTTTQVEKHQQ